MTVLMTGASGFIGEHLTMGIASEGYEIVAMHRPKSDNTEIFAEEDIVAGDLLNYESVEKAVKSVKPNIILHLAALTPVRLSWEEELLYANTDYLGTIRLLKACIKHCPEDFWFIFASTAEVYGDNPRVEPMKETDPLTPTSPYAVAKVASELHLKMRGKNRDTKFKWSIMRCNNTFGRPHSGYFVETMMEQILNADYDPFYDHFSPSITVENGEVRRADPPKPKAEVSLYNPTHIRDYMFLPDHVGAYLHVLKNKLYGTFNVAQGYPVSNRTMVNLMAELVGIEPIIKIKEPEFPRPGDQRAIMQDCSKIRDTGWKPLYTREEGILTLREMYDGLRY